MTNLKAYKNDKLRREFLEQQTFESGWYVWFDVPQIDRIFKRVDCDKVTFICELKQETIHWPKEEVVYDRGTFYMIPAEDLLENGEAKKPFQDYRASMTECVNMMKECQKAEVKA